MSHAWMPFYVADYLGKTQRLSAAEHGAYMLLIMEYWQTGKPPPDDDDQLARICRMTTREWKRMRSVIQSFFYDGWFHHRIEEELVKADEKHELRVEAGRRGGTAAASAKQSSSNADSNATSKAQASSSQPQPQSSSLRSDDTSARGELISVLDEQHADAVIDHRRRLRKPLSPHAGKLLAEKFAQCPDPNAAADAMIANGWQGFDPDWLSRPSNNRWPPGKPRFTNGYAALANEIAEERYGSAPYDTPHDSPSHADARPGNGKAAAPDLVVDAEQSRRRGDAH